MPSLIYLVGLSSWLVLLASLVILLLRLRRVRRRANRSLQSINFGLAGWFALAILTLPELYFAFVYDATDSFSQTNVSRKWFARHVVANKAGFRNDRELPASREPGVKYIGFVGDSFTFGHGIRRTANRFSDRVARDLDAAQPNRTRVVNTALPGVEIRALTDQLVPDLIQSGVPMDELVYVFVPNDIEYLDEHTAQFYQAQQSRSPQFFLWRDTYFYNWLYHRVRGMLSANKGDYYGYLAEAYTGPPWLRFTAKLEELQGLCDAHGVALRVVIFPFLNTLGDGDPFAPAYERLIAHCADKNVPCLDLRRALLPHVREGLMVNRFDAHPNERAHELAAEAILKELEGVVPTAPSP